MSASHALAARIGARLRAHLAEPEWSWRYTPPAVTDPADVAAVARLRADRARAARWLEVASAAVGLSLPAGNGTAGPWHRQAVLDAEHRLGICDIAAGRVAWTDTVAPSYVRRFAVPTDRATSPHEAGGSSGLGSAVAQVAVVCGMRDVSRPRISPLPRPRVTWVEWGLQTCYGDCGGPPTADDWREEWRRIVARPGVEVRETTTTQWVVVLSQVDRALVEAWRGSGPPWAAHRSSTVRVRGGNYASTCHVEVLGVGDERRQRVAALRAAWETWACNEVARRATALVRDLLAGAGIPVSPCHAEGTRHVSASEWQPDDVRVQRHLLGLATPPDPLTPEERAVVRAAAADLLARDPQAVGLSLRDPWGHGGYPDGANRLGYLPGCERLKHEEDVLAEPGVAEWLAAVRRAADSQRRAWA